MSDRGSDAPALEPEPQTTAERYRREAIELRRAAEIIRDEQFRHQFLCIAEDYDAWAAAIQAEVSGQNKE